MNPLRSKQVFRYHEATKHSYQRFARSLGYLDWATQPNLFRVFEKTEQIPLRLINRDRNVSHINLYKRTRNSPCAIELNSIAAFLELSLGLSAWKSFQGNRWSLRMNPSSGNLHPTECYLLLPSMKSTPAGVFHYNPHDHALERRANIPQHHWGLLKEHFQADGFLFVLTSVFWREAWKYGERAFRYCQHDLGHALAALSFSANLLGWTVTYLYCLSDHEIEKLLGFQKTVWPPSERECPELACLVYPTGQKPSLTPLSPDIFSAFQQLSFLGTPNLLSDDHVDWEIISEIEGATEKPRTEKPVLKFFSIPYLQDTEIPFFAEKIIRKRRSLLACDGKTSITKDQFLEMLDKTLPRVSCAPFDVALGESHLNLFVFVHRVTGLPSGLYFFIRNEKHLEELQMYSEKRFVWKKVEEPLPLYFLVKGNYQQTATLVSCNQNIAGDSAFSLGMISRFRQAVETAPFMYRQLFWESGMIGQVLYLEAEAHGVRSTGIGCFFDDPVHEIIGLSGHEYQSLYHFTVGGAVDDPRLETNPPYSHLQKSDD